MFVRTFVSFQPAHYRFIVGIFRSTIEWSVLLLFVFMGLLVCMFTISLLVISSLMSVRLWELGVSFVGYDRVVTVLIGRVGDFLQTTIGQVDVVGPFSDIPVTLLLMTEVSSIVGIAYTIFEPIVGWSLLKEVETCVNDNKSFKGILNVRELCNWNPSILANRKMSIYIFL